MLVEMTADKEVTLNDTIVKLKSHDEDGRKQSSPHLVNQHWVVFS